MKSPQQARGRKLSLTPSSFLCYVMYLIALALVGKWAASGYLNVEFVPINGTFQTFNPLARIDRGEVPFRDFIAYLGAGPIFVIKALRPGTSLADVMLATRIACGWSFVLLWATLCRAFGVWGPVHGSLAVALVFSFLNRPAFSSASISFYHERLTDLFFPGVSILALRILLPVLIVNAAWLLHSRARHLLNGKEKRWSATFGILTGAGIAWSNDYGIPSIAAAFVCTCLRSQMANGCPGERLKAALKHLAWFLSCAFFGAFLSLAAITHGSPTTWYEYNFLGAARDQFFYFEGGGVYSWKQFGFLLRFELFLLASILMSFGPNFLRRKLERDGDYFISIFFVLTSFFAGTLTSLGGHFDRRYFSLFYLICLARLCSALPIKKIAYYLRDLSQYRQNVLGVKGKRVITKLGFFLMSCCALWVLSISFHPNLQQASVPGWMDVPELGGQLSPRFQRSVAWGRRLNKELQGMPAKEKIFSTYASSIDLMADASHPSRSDYIIHALGPRERSAYLSAFEKAKTPYVTTVRNKANEWERWIRAANWPFYAALVRNYVPFAKAENHVIWQRKSGGLVPSEASMSCTVEQKTPAIVSLRVMPKDIRQAPLGHREKAKDRLVEVSVHYNLSYVPELSLLEGPRQALIRVTSRIERDGHALDLLDQDLPNNLNISATNNQVTLPVTVVQEGESLITFTSLPSKDAQLRVTSCSAVDLVPQAALEDFCTQELTPSISCEGEHDRGVLNEQGRTGICVDPEEAGCFRSKRSKVYIDGGDERDVEGVEGTRVWLSGPALDPQRVGYPNFVRIVYE